MSDVKKPLALIILDGFGYSEDSQFNAIRNANAPTFEHIWSECPHTLIGTSGLSVGLPEGQMGNSEVGHTTLGAGRVVYQNFTRINKAIADGDFFDNTVYGEAIERAVANNGAVHIMGLMSPGGVHSHEDHILAAIKLAAQKGAQHIYLHAFLDGRDVPPRSAEASLKKADELFAEIGKGRTATLCGRFYAMDRDSRWPRVQEAYDLLTLGKAEYHAPNALAGLHAAYVRDEDDEFVHATTIGAEGAPDATFNDGDCVLFMNFRPDRARQLSRAFTDVDFDGFDRRKQPKLASFVQTTEYSHDIDAPVAFPAVDLSQSFGEVMALKGKRQLRIAETEKYAHVTFFFSGGREDTFEGEDRILVPSPNVETYDQQPEMSAPEVTAKLIEAIESGKYDAIVCNYANCDQVGHTGDYDASIKAVEAVDRCLKQVFEALEKVGGEALITADHGNVELMFDTESNQKHTQHTTLPVPLVYVGKREIQLSSDGSLADIAPTMLDLMSIEQPKEMTGHSLVTR